MSTRERICAIEIEEDGLLLTTLRTAQEVRDASEFAGPDLPKPDPRMLDIAGKIIEQQAGDFDPSEFQDRYEDALRAVIEEKKKGRPVRPTQDAERDDTVVDLMEALKRSLGTAPAKPKAANRNTKAGKGRKRAA
jgi:DNA end-binding protein Ku